MAFDLRFDQAGEYKRLRARLQPLEKEEAAHVVDDIVQTDTHRGR